jgi:hypothetical protein
MVKIQKPIRFENECGAIVDYDELRKAIIWFSDKPQQSIKHIYMHGKYPAVSIFKTKIHIHRLLMMYWLNTDIPFEYSVHHLNENKMDARKENLALILNTSHLSKHNKGRKPSNGAIHKLVERNHNSKGKRRSYKRSDVSIEEVWDLHLKGYSINKISIKLGCDWTTVQKRIYDVKDNPEILEEESE